VGRCRSQLPSGIAGASTLANPGVAGKLSAPLLGLPAEQQARFRAQLVVLPAEIDVLHLRNLAWPMAELQERHRALGHHLSAAMVEALAAAHVLEAGIAVAMDDVGPGLMAAANEDGISFHAL
jgi:hypothetical protein